MGLLLVADKEKEVNLTLGSGRIGLCNVGNTCFLNSMVQCLSHTRTLRDYCLQKKYRQEVSSRRKTELMNAFSEVLSDLWTTDMSTAVHPGNFNTIFKESVPHFIGYSQQDAQEFLHFLLDRLHSEINRTSPQNQPISDLPESKYNKLREDKKAMLMWKHYLEREDSKIVDLFAGQLKSSLRCSSCGHESTTFDVFYDLSLPIPKGSVSGGRVSLKDCLALFSQVEELKSDNAPMCDRCGKHTDSTKKLTIQRFPKILVLHLNRFCASRFSISKSTATVSFPIHHLDLGDYGTECAGKVLYNLYAICNHCGTVHIGHYTAYCQQERGWFCYNDSRVSPVSESQLQSNKAYVLFYEME
ncbi:ubiquitin carboxyl-terminal hydrolase 21 isoform X1 [Acipenser ruthenus]|uniref:ubiquitin carboxyl-terminal hydrolase 21 isoform X1 n=2 Tax=Acipenser ruthenus TaxID=7906 RepID=UPI0027421921|nr:ubiquitin carboxyl-terminal hydrolase 21 isoform X1 [Acipenser ruthenus]